MVDVHLPQLCRKDGQGEVHTVTADLEVTPHRVTPELGEVALVSPMQDTLPSLKISLGEKELSIPAERVVVRCLCYCKQPLPAWAQEESWT